MILLGAGEVAGLKARGLAKQERDPLLRNERIRFERQRAHMRALIAVPPAKFRPGELGRIAHFHVELVRVAPAQHQLTEDELPLSLEPVGAGVALHLGLNLDLGLNLGTVQALRRTIGKVTFVFRQEVGPWTVRFTISDDSPVLENVDSPELDS